jgi:hypothetical protein
VQNIVLHEYYNLANDKNREGSWKPVNLTMPTTEADEDEGAKNPEATTKKASSSFLLEDCRRR